MLIATGASAMTEIAADARAEYAALRDAVMAVSIELAQAIVRDGEGATKFITVKVEGGRNDEECRKDRLRDCAFAAGEDGIFCLRSESGADPGGHRLCGHHRSRYVDSVDLYLDDVLVAERGGRSPELSRGGRQRA